MKVNWGLVVAVEIVVAVGVAAGVAVGVAVGVAGVAAAAVGDYLETRKKDKSTSQDSSLERKNEP